MADIIYGMGVSHSPHLSTPPEQWDRRAVADKRNPAHPFRGGIYTFDELVELRKDENLGARCNLDVYRELDAKNQARVKQLADRFAEAAPDILVIMGNDQREVFQPSHTPGFLVYYGDTVVNKAVTAEAMQGMSPGIAESVWGTNPETDITYPCEPGLANHIISTLIREEFDVAASNELPRGDDGPRSIPHAFGFLYRRILNDRPIITVPIFTNTFFPPNQPTAKRVLEFGKAVGRAIRSWDSDLKVAVSATGGFSHFVIDEDLDHRILDALANRDDAAIIGEPESSFQSGSSEIKNYIATAGVLDGTGLKMELLDYIPCYRSEAGTGNAMVFMTWS
jgi:hypothetical protein